MAVIQSEKPLAIRENAIAIKLYILLNSIIAPQAIAKGTSRHVATMADRLRSLGDTSVEDRKVGDVAGRFL